MARFRLSPEFKVALPRQRQAILHRDSAAEFFDPRDGLRRCVFEMGESDPLARKRLLAMDRLDHLEQLPCAVILRGVQMKVVAVLGKETDEVTEFFLCARRDNKALGLRQNAAVSRPANQRPPETSEAEHIAGRKLRDFFGGRLQVADRGEPETIQLAKAVPQTLAYSVQAKARNLAVSIFPGRHPLQHACRF